MRWFKSLKEDRIKLQLEQEQLALDKSELATREAAVAEREQTVAKKESDLVRREAAVTERERNVAQQQYKLKIAEEREQEASKKIREAEDMKCELDRKKHMLYQNFEETVARKVAAGIRGKEVGINKNWEYLFRKEHKLNEYEQKILKQAQLIADHLGVPLRCILTPREKKLVDQSANELTEEHCALREEHYALIDLVMSCPENQLKDLLASTQQFQRNLRR